MELSVMARNWSGITGNTETVTTAETGNGTEGGNEGGVVIDPAAEPQVSGLKMSGTLEAGLTLTATYAFAANGGNAQDKSTFAWGYEGTTGSAVAGGQTVTASGQVPGRALTTEDVGKVMELSVQARNGAGTAGNTETVTTVDAITTGSPVQENSFINTNTTTYVVGADMTVTVTLKNAGGIAVTGQKAALTTTSVTVPNATLKTGSGWSDNEDGTYTATYSAETVSTSNQASLKLNGWVESRTSESYVITAAPKIKNITANKYTFAKDAGFPTTGFTGATFNLNIENGSASDFIWESSVSWVTVDNGVVRLIAEGTGNNVTITGTPVNGKGGIVTYRFKLSSWFKFDPDNHAFSDEVDTGCSAFVGYTVPRASRVIKHSNFEPDISRSVGAYLNEWGDGSLPPGSSNAYAYWTSDRVEFEYEPTNYAVYAGRNGIDLQLTWDKLPSVCFKEF
jgi:adhesin/invasin